MKPRDIDIDYLFLLEALDSGVVPGPEQVETLVHMGLVECGPDGVSLTMAARLKLMNLRSLMRGYDMPE